MIADAIIVIAPAVIVLAVVQILLLVRQPVGLKQDDPAKLGHPMASPATPAAAHAAILRRT